MRLLAKNPHYGLGVWRLTGRLASELPPRHAQAGVSRSSKGALVMAQNSLTLGVGPRCVRGHHGVLLIMAHESLTLGAGPRCVCWHRRVLVVAH